MTDSTQNLPEPAQEAIQEQSKSPPLTRNRNFMALFSGGFISDIGTYFSIIGVIFLAIDKTSHLTTSESAQLVALITVARIVPTLIFGPFAGVLVDRFDRKRIMWLNDFFSAGVVLGFVFVTSINQMFILAFLASFAQIFFYPARGASIPKIVKTDQLVSANGFIQTSTQISVLLGPAMAGLLIGRYGLNVAFYIDALTFVVSGFLIMIINTDLKPAKVNGKLTFGKVFSDLKDGLIIVKNDSVISFILVLFGVSLIGVGMINPLFAFYLENEFSMTERDFGFILSFSAISGLITAITITRRKHIERKVRLMWMGIYVVGIGMLLVGLAAHLNPSPLYLYLGMAVIGSVNVLFNIPFSALMQAIVDNEDLGKISGFMGTILALSQTIGALLATILVIYYDISFIFISIALFLFGVAFLFGFIMRSKHINETAIEREREAIIKMQELQQKASEELAPTIIEETLPSDNDAVPTV